MELLSGQQQSTHLEQSCTKDLFDRSGFLGGLNTRCWVFKKKKKPTATIYAYCLFIDLYRSPHTTPQQRIGRDFLSACLQHHTVPASLVAIPQVPSDFRWPRRVSVLEGHAITFQTITHFTRRLPSKLLIHQGSMLRPKVEEYLDVVTH